MRQIGAPRRDRLARLWMIKAVSLVLSACFDRWHNICFFHGRTGWSDEMSGKTGFERCWQGVDRTLLLLVFALLGFSFWESRKNGFPEGMLEPLKSSEPSEPVRRVRPSSGTVTAGTPVSLSRNRMSTIARTMSDQGWDDLPSSLAADMREQNGIYEIFFALPRRTDPSSVKVSTSGNVLTLFVNSAGAPPATFMKQFYIPCGAERAGKVETSVSNDIVRVRIRQRNG